MISDLINQERLERLTPSDRAIVLLQLYPTDEDEAFYAFQRQELRNLLGGKLDRLRRLRNYDQLSELNNPALIIFTPDESGSYDIDEFETFFSHLRTNGLEDVPVAVQTANLKSELYEAIEDRIVSMDYTPFAMRTSNLAKVIERI